MKTKKREALMVILVVNFMLLMSCSESSVSPLPSPVNADNPYGNGVLAIVEFDALPPEIIAGQSGWLSWTVKNADRVEIDQGIGTVQSEGEVTVTPAQTTKYTLTATQGDRTATLSCILTVE